MIAHDVRTEDVTAFADKAEWTGVRVAERAKWLSMRRTMLTASDLAAIMGEDEHRSPLDVYVDKVTIAKDEEVLALDDPRFWGNVLEQPVLRAVAQYHGWKYREGGALLRSRRLPFLGATLDAEVDTGDGVWLDLEGKTTRIPRGWDEETGELPTRVLIQVQAQLLVTGAARAIVFALLQGSRPVTIYVEPSLDFHAVLAEVGAAFMMQVHHRVAPLPTGKDRDGRALQRLYPAEDGSVVALPADALEWTREYQAIAQQLRGLERRKAHFQQLLKHALGPATYGVLPDAVGGKRCWRWQTQERPPYEVDATTARVLVALKEPPPVRGALPPANDTLVRELEASTTADDDTQNAEPIRFGPRRRSRR